MSCTNNTDSPPVEPLHHPEQAALQPRGHPLANVTNASGQEAISLGQKALLAKRMAKHNNPKMISPTDNFMTPVSAKLSQTKKKHFTKGKPVGLASAFSLASQPEQAESEMSPALQADGTEKSGIDF